MPPGPKLASGPHAVRAPGINGAEWCCRFCGVPGASVIDQSLHFFEETFFVSMREGEAPCRIDNVKAKGSDYFLAEGQLFECLRSIAVAFGPVRRGGQIIYIDLP